MTPLTRDQYIHAMRCGLGRTVLHAREFGVDGLEEEILAAALHNFGYDQQLEGSRAEWMTWIIECSERQEWFRERIVSAPEDPEEFWDSLQLLDLLAYYAEQGDAAARTRLYEIFEKQEHNENWYGGKQIVRLDGINGMLYVAHVIGARVLRSDYEAYEYDLLHDVYEEYGRRRVRARLKKAAATDINVQAYLDSIDAGRKKWGRRPLPTRTTLTVDDILEQVDRGDAPRLRLVRFGETASDEEIEILFERLLCESNTPQLYLLLKVFHRRAVPRIDPKLFALTTHSDEETRDAALQLLSNLTDASVRALGLEMLVSGPSRDYSSAIRLVSSNYIDGDDELILSTIGRLTDVEDIHASGYALLLLAKANPSASSQLLEWVYENTTCSNCRKESVELLIARGEATSDLLEECRWDAEEDTRQLAIDELARRTA